MSPISDPPPSPSFKDRRTGLIVFGVLQALLGGLCFLFVPLLFLSQAMQARVTGAPPAYRMMLPAVGIYGAMAVVFLCLGIGSILARRWARALSLILAWSWLAVGVVTVIVTWVVLPRTLAMPVAPNQAMPPGAARVVMIVSLGMVSMLFVVLPGVLLLFYRSPHVKATCEARDPVARWTDACPLPVLGLALWLASGALSLLLMPVGYGGVLPCFGVLISGWAGTLACLALAGLWAYLARATYRLEPRAWWIVLGLVILFSVSAYLTFRGIDLFEMYRRMGYPEAQIEQMRQFQVLDGQTLAPWSAVALVPVIAYLLWVKHFFRSGAAEVEARGHA
jgi:hypothetical protein